MPKKRTFRMGWYILGEDNTAIPWPDQKLREWSKIMAELTINGRTVVMQEQVGDRYVSTVFIGLDHNFVNRIRFEDPDHKSQPHIFETMVFNRQEGDDELGESIDCVRWSTWNEALEGHKNIVNQVGMFLKLKREEGI